MDKGIPLNIGIDIVEIKRIKKAIEKNDRFLKRIYHEEEISYCEERKMNKFQSYGGIYAAKEAFFKALGTGFRDGTWHEVRVTHNMLGAPELIVEGTFLSVMEAKGYQRILLSISHTKDYACSQVILL